MNRHEIFSINYDKESLANCDTTLLRELIAQNFKKIEQDIAELSEVSDKLKNEEAKKAIA